jgi:hypothetical protein
MQNDNILVAVLMLLLGGGGVGGIGLAVNAWRAHKKGKIEDDGTLIERLNAENRDLAAKNATHQRFEQLWMTQAFRYRRQVVRDSDVDPDDMEELWDTGTPKVLEP